MSPLSRSWPFYSCRASTVRIDNYTAAVAFSRSIVLLAHTMGANMMPPTAILYYDFALTLVSEIEFFWTSANWSIISVLFVVNRYFGLLGAIPIGFEYFGTPSEHVGFSFLIAVWGGADLFPPRRKKFR